MNVALREPMMLAEFLAWEERQELKFEFDGLAPVGMSGATVGHSTIQGNLAAALQPRLRGRPCRFYGSDLKFRTAEGTIRYPDGMVVCRPVDRNAKLVDSPVVVFEVLSPSTTRTDRIAKARKYQATPTVQRYVMLEQDGVAAVVYARNGDTWTHDILVADSALDLPELGLEFALAELYEGIAFEQQDEGAAETP